MATKTWKDQPEPAYEAICFTSSCLQTKQKRNDVYSVTEERVGSEDNILDDKEDLKGIMRTREVTVQHAEKADQMWPLGQ